MTDKQSCKVFCGGLSWETSSERLRAYFENFGVVREAFVSYNRNNGRPRGFGFVVFESPEVADKVVATKHTIDRREVECKKAVPKEEGSSSSPPSSNEGSSVRTKKIFVGGLAPSVDDKMLRQHFEQFGTVEDAVVMYDHDNKRPRGFGFVTFASEESVDKVFGRGAMQMILDKQIEIKPAVPRDQMPAAAAGGRMPYFEAPRGGFGGRGYGPGYGGMPPPYGQGFRGYGPRGAYNVGPGPMGPPPGSSSRGPRGYNGPMPPAGNMPFPGGAGGMPRGYGGNFGGKGMGMGYDFNYAAGLQNGGANNMFGTNAQALYNLTAANLAAATQPHLNGSMPGAGGKIGNTFNPSTLKQQLALGAAGLAGLSAGFGFAGQTEGFHDEGTYPGAEADYAAAGAVDLNASGLQAVQAEFNAAFHDTAGFTASPAPGWSS
uniref:RRM domain-containing protein n=1 Tax=Chlamydomonas leiostraca TaxID=1034604 RepID=A0A7S0RI27_9CHLO|mmetsp:Transcript_23323/g.59670  ORF Transcript_23323/g.59670 Transcript_23323/m.59670 type:complete len:432 (+) Transcript_23323:154-1449(+)|eukprot:CAMPEP_0202863506 /NCGR_PEP_ID=MMETSP1391-20130828/4116_1 /ASSEMBLY_ACC=CAM_ASM_000867 /TAXON_ID=1034604 /ORGANISM="Chlamydomonas leiostraca, Strain SAG 11-49" /LENGTH=431 /DNA_ID=CAMNT_0049543153 /DNA_START=150 /DNA_END=1445 /DNA_ORIENTATION=-